MRTVFADTSYFIAMLCQEDENHTRALAFASERMRLVTTQWVMSELAAYLSTPGDRELFVRTLNTLERSLAVEIIPASSASFHAGVQRYADRSDKQWSLVDCISFCMMSERGLTDALTIDHHFTQAGFAALLK